MRRCDEVPVEQLAEEILTYLHSRKHAADTMEGIARWWLLRVRIQDETLRVEKAIQSLFDKGLIKKMVLPDGNELYACMDQNAKDEENQENRMDHQREEE